MLNTNPQQHVPVNNKTILNEVRREGDRPGVFKIRWMQ